MRRIVPLLVAVFGGALVGVACYSQNPAPPAFRNECVDDTQCNAGETCVRNLCEVKCTQANFKDACRGGNHVFCLNGLCTTACPLNKPEVCPGDKQCINLGLSAGSSSPFGGSSTAIGLCGVQCDAQNVCPSGEECTFGFCIATCVSDKTCFEGFVCNNGHCTPEGGFDPGDVMGTSGTSGEGGSSESGGLDVTGGGLSEGGLTMTGGAT